MKRPRIYADTSVFGGYFDDEFAEITRKFFEELRKGAFVLVLSDTTLRELRRCPQEVRELLRGIPTEHLENVALSEEIQGLRDAYLGAGVVGEASISDAEHIASASVAGVDIIVSWNFKHIVHFSKIRGYHAVNLLQGYTAIPIHSPQEVVES